MASRRTRAPRTNSWVIVAATNAQSAKQMPDDQTRTPRPTKTAVTAAMNTTGQRNESRRLARVERRHASSGATPVRSSRTRPIGVIQRLKNGGPTVSRFPVSASLSVGNIVPNSTSIAAMSRIQLLATNAASRETHESRS